MASDTLDTLFSDLLALQDLSSKSLPPVHLWNPKKSGDMDLIIDREGRWIHEGGEIKRAPLVKLFSQILKFEDGQHYLVTPVEKWRISVEIAPFYITLVNREIRQQEPAISCVTSTGDTVVVSDENPLWVDHDFETNQPVPLVQIRKGLTGLLSRAAYYQLVDWAEANLADNGNELFVTSMGQKFVLGQID